PRSNLDECTDFPCTFIRCFHVGCAKRQRVEVLPRQRLKRLPCALNRATSRQPAEGLRPVAPAGLLSRSPGRAPAVTWPGTTLMKIASDGSAAPYLRDVVRGSFPNLPYDEAAAEWPAENALASSR